MKTNRARRIAELIRRIVSEVLMFKIKHPEAKKASVQAVEVTDNLRHVKVRVYVRGDEAQKKATMQALEHSIGFFKKEIGEQAKLRNTPDVEFIFDKSLDHAEKIENLLKSLK